MAPNHVAVSRYGMQAAMAGIHGHVECLHAIHGHVLCMHAIWVKFGGGLLTRKRM